ncbi:hypothetical protein [Mesorhizobium ventifaucium]|uniref:Uncharacterized protein n=1 Tax=Mesorhizobium ventifaucium TaxID=666020 RepID=A0ABN8J8F3_9HYPH|nr:hypothetical protein [Mesorhizobium ventifaucium]CAH2394151.1 conserved membrane hypothetical protein [Mesorhizobium ventifaucium]
MADRKLLFSQILAAVGLFFWSYYILTYVLGMPLFLNTESDNQLVAQIGFGIYGYIILLVGVMLGAVYQELKIAKADGKGQVKIGATLRRATRTADFWLGIFASPVVYAVLLQAIDMTNVTASAFIGITLVGLQNGFVCNTVAESFVKNGPSGQSAPSPKN